MISITKLVLRRPVSTFLAVLSLVFFGFIAFTTMKMELLPDMNFPYMIVTTVYPGASPEDVDELISKPVEEEVSLLSNVQEVQSRSMENLSMVIIRYRYGTNMDKAYDNLKKKLDVLKANLPEEAEDPEYIEFDNSAGYTHLKATVFPVKDFWGEGNRMLLQVLSGEDDEIYSTQDIYYDTKAFDIDVDITGYEKVRLKAVRVSQYRLDIAVANARFE